MKPEVIQLSSIKYENENGSWGEFYHYDEEARLIRIEAIQLEGNNYELAYAGSVLQEILCYHTNEEEVISKDSFEYDNENRVEEAFHFSLQAGEMLLFWRYEFIYDNSGKLIEKHTRFRNDTDLLRTEKYTWEEGNIVKTESYNGLGEIIAEYIYSYDKKQNYKRAFPRSIIDGSTEYWNENNIVKTELKDYTGLIDWVCNPCESEYKYNNKDYPREITQTWGQKTIIEYQ